MANRQREAALRLTTRMLSRAATEIVYSTGSVEYTMDAVFGRSEFLLSGEYGSSTIERSDKDFLVSPDDLPIEPEAGHTVTVDGETYEVSAPTGMPVWRWSNSHHTLKRIHTKMVADGN